MFKIKSRNSSIKRGLILGTAATCLSLTLVPSAFADNIAVFDEQPDTNLNTNLNTNLYAQYEELLKEENNKFEDNLDKRFGLTTLWESVARSWNSEIYEKEKNSDELNASIYRGFQNPSQYYQVSNESVTIKNQGDGEFGFRQESRIGIDATREECIETMIEVAYEYLDANTPYIWDYACAPGVGVDCAGLVLQCLYATGMDLTTHE